MGREPPLSAINKKPIEQEKQLYLVQTQMFILRWNTERAFSGCSKIE